MLLRILKSKFIGFKLNLILLLLIIRYICGAQAFFLWLKKAFWKKDKNFSLLNYFFNINFF